MMLYWMKCLEFPPPGVQLSQTFGFFLIVPSPEQGTSHTILSNSNFLLSAICNSGKAPPSWLTVMRQGLITRPTLDTSWKFRLSQILVVRYVILNVNILLRRPKWVLSRKEKTQFLSHCLPCHILMGQIRLQWQCPMEEHHPVDASVTRLAWFWIPAMHKCPTPCGWAWRPTTGRESWKPVPDDSVFPSRFRSSETGERLFLPPFPKCPTDLSQPSARSDSRDTKA